MPSTMKYYIRYRYRIWYETPSGRRPCRDNRPWHDMATVLADEHPVDWLLRQREDYGYEAWEAHGQPMGTDADRRWQETELLFFQRIPEDVWARADEAEFGY